MILKLVKGHGAILPLRQGGGVHNGVLKTAIRRSTKQRYHPGSTPASQAWWRTLLGPALGRQRQADLCKFESSLVYMENSRPARNTQ